MRKLLLQIVFFAFVAMSTKSYAQNQVNVTHFVNRTSKSESPRHWDANTCTVPKTTSDIFFMITAGIDVDVNYQELDKQIKLWDTQLEKIDENLDPALCCYTSSLIQTVKQRVESILTAQRAAAIAAFDANAATSNTAKFKRYSDYIKNLDKRAKMFFGVNRIHGNPKWYYRFFPARYREEAAIVYQKYGAALTQVGTNVAIYGWENRGTINPELVSTFFGPFRFAVNTLLTSTDTDTSITEEAQLRTLTGNGGNLVASFYYAIHHYSNSWLTSLFQFSPKFATELPILNSPFKGRNVYSNGNIGVDLSVNIRLGDVLGGASLYLYARPSYIFASKAYKEALKINDDFWLLQPVIGLDIPSLGKFAFNFPVASNAKSLTTDSYLISFTVSPQNLINK